MVCILFSWFFWGFFPHDFFLLFPSSFLPLFLSFLFLLFEGHLENNSITVWLQLDQSCTPLTPPHPFAPWPLPPPSVSRLEEEMVIYMSSVPVELKNINVKNNSAIFGFFHTFCFFSPTPPPPPPTLHTLP